MPVSSCKNLGSPSTQLSHCYSLLQYVKDLRSQFDDFEAIGMNKCDPSEVTSNAAYYADTQSQRIRKRKRHHDELDSVGDVTLTGRDMFRVTAFLPVIDKLCATLTQSLAVYQRNLGFYRKSPTKQTLSLKQLLKSLCLHIL